MFEQREFRPGVTAKFGVLWCRLWHAEPMWPIRGRYSCRICGRSYWGPWAGADIAESACFWIQPKERVVKRAA
jgi:hypothetical protein